MKPKELDAIIKMSKETAEKSMSGLTLKLYKKLSKVKQKENNNNSRNPKQSHFHCVSHFLAFANARENQYSSLTGGKRTFYSFLVRLTALCHDWVTGKRKHEINDNNFGFPRQNVIL